jgi:hypothetical protein
MKGIEFAVELRRHQRHDPDRDRHRDQIGQYRDHAAQQSGIETGDDGDNQSEIDDGIETVHGWEFSASFAAA